MFRKNNERKNNARNARKMRNGGNFVASVKRVALATRNEIAADTLAMAAGMGSAAVLNNSICGIVNGAAKGYYDAAGVTLAVKKHRWSKEILVNSKELTFKPKSARLADKGWWFNPTTCKKVTDVVATTSVVAGAVAGTATRGIVKDALIYHAESQGFEESWDSYYEEDAAEE